MKRSLYHDRASGYDLPQPMSAFAQLSPDLVAMMARGVSVNVASRDARLRPSAMRAMGSAVNAQAGTVTVYLARSQAEQLLRDIAAGGPIAVMFSEPSTHRTVQLKAASATCRDATERDVPVLRRYLASMEVEVQRVGHPPRLTRAILAWRLADLVALTFAPAQVFEQTPGARAGHLMAAAP